MPKSNPENLAEKLEDALAGVDRACTNLHEVLARSGSVECLVALQLLKAGQELRRNIDEFYNALTADLESEV